METSETSTQIEQVISKISQVLVQKNQKLFKNDQQMKSQIQQLQKKQKNLHLLYVKEQLKVEKLQNEIGEIRDSSMSDSSCQNDILKENNQADNKHDINSLRAEIENNNIQAELYDQQIAEAKDYLEKAKKDLNQKYDNLSHFEVELESCGKQLEFLKNKCDEKIKYWESIRNQTKQKEKQTEELKANIKQKQIEIDKEKESHDKNIIQMQLYDQLEERIIKQIQVNQEKTNELLDVNKVLEQKLSEISEQPQQLKKLLKVANQMLKEKNLLLENQIQKIQKQQQTVSLNQANSLLRIKSTSQFSDMQSDISSNLHASSIKKFQSTPDHGNGNIFFSRPPQINN